MTAWTRLRTSIEQVTPLVDGTREDDMGLATPCAGWTVRDLLNHMAGALVMFHAVAVDGSADPALFDSDLLGSDPAGAFRAAGRDALDAWDDPAKQAGMAKLPFGEFPAEFALQLPAMDMIVHGWDLARATGRHAPFDDALIAETDAFCRATFTDEEIRQGSFDPPVPEPAGADRLTRLAAFMGRAV